MYIDSLSRIHIIFAIMKIPPPMEYTFTNDMELDSKNIKLLFKIWSRYIKRNWRTLFGKFLAYMYLFIAYGFMTLYFSYNIRIAVKPLGFMAISLITIGAYFLYFVINHILIRLVISHKTLIIFDLLALIMLVCIAISDFWLSK